MAFTAADVKNLREMTGCGMMDCKKALVESDGDMDKAVEWLREKGLAASQKKAGRIAAEGMAYAAVYDGVGVVVEVNSETDFVAKNEKFVAFVKGVAETVAKQDPKDLEALMACKYLGGELTVEQQQQEMVLTIGENIKVRRFARYAAGLRHPLRPHWRPHRRYRKIWSFPSCLEKTRVPSRAGARCHADSAALNAPFLDKSTVPAETLGA